MPALKTRDELKIKLDQCGYTDLKDGNTQKTVTVLLPKGSDRVDALMTIATKLKSFGGTYNGTQRKSTTGHVDLSGQFVVVAKHKGSGGSGAGAGVTKLTESAQCVYNAAHYAGQPYTHAGLKKNSAKFDVDEQMKNILTALPDDWITSSKLTAENLKKRFPKTNYTHHRGSRWVGELYSHYKEMNKEAGKPFGDENKWNPADIWMCTPKGETALRELKKTETLVDLNAKLIEYYNTGDIVGVSLKKVVGSVTAKEMNVGRNRSTYNFESMTLGLTSFWNSQDGYIYFDGGRAQFRTFGTTWQGELKGKNANMGKMSGGPIKGLYDHIAGPQRPKFVPQIKVRDRTDENIKQFYEWYCMVPDLPKMSEYDFYKELKDKTDSWYLSKIQSTQIIALVSQFNTKDKNRFSSGLANYAGSESELSGPYYKVM